MEVGNCYLEQRRSPPETSGAQRLFGVGDLSGPGTGFDPEAKRVTGWPGTERQNSNCNPAVGPFSVELSLMRLVLVSRLVIGPGAEVPGK